MKLDNMFKKTRIVSRIQSHNAARASRPEVPEGLLRKCNKCGAAIIAEDVKQGNYICPKCGGYFRIHAYRRIQMVIDEGTFEEWDHDLTGGNPVNYKGYPEKVQALQEKTGLKEAVVTGRGKINGRETVIAVCDGRFLMASMGWAVGEKITRACNGRKTSGHHFCLFRRSQNAGRHYISDADGKDIGGTGTPQ